MGETLVGRVTEVPRHGETDVCRVEVCVGDMRIASFAGTVCGDGVNIAARLQALALPGRVTVSESVRTPHGSRAS